MALNDSISTTLLADSRAVIGRLLSALDTTRRAPAKAAWLIAIRRDFHSLKAAAGFLDLVDCEAICDECETRMECVAELGADELDELHATVVALDRRFADAAVLQGEGQQFESLRGEDAGHEAGSVNAFLATLPQYARMLATRLGKTIVLRTGGDISVADSEITAGLREVVLQLLRNAIDHGIEEPAARCQAGKAPCGEIDLDIIERDDVLTLRMRDDGRGIDTDALRRNATRDAMMRGRALCPLGQVDDLELVCSPGISGRGGTGAISGRGMGMNIVRSRIESLGGQLRVSSRSGLGTDVLLVIPLAHPVRMAQPQLADSGVPA